MDILSKAQLPTRTHLAALAHARLEAGVLKDDLAVAVHVEFVEVVLVRGRFVGIEELDVEDELGEAGQVVLR